MNTNQEIFSLPLQDEEDLRLFLQDIGFIIDEENYLLNKNLVPVLDDNDNPILYTNVSAILPGSKIIVKNKDYGKVASYVMNYLV